MRFLVFLLGLSALLAAICTYWLHSFNHFSEVDRAFDGQCSPFTGLDGPSDIEIDTSQGIAYISSKAYRASTPTTSQGTSAGTGAERGKIYGITLNDPLNNDGFRDRTGGIPSLFRPGGIDFYEGEGLRQLFVVNEATNGIELFDVSEAGELSHFKTITDPRLTSPKSVVAVGPEQFYVTNDVKLGGTFVQITAQLLTGNNAGEVFYLDKGTVSLVAKDLRIASGLELSRDGTTLYVAETAAKAIKVYDRNPADGLLSDAGLIKLEAAPDNIALDEAGDLWIGAHPKLLMSGPHPAGSGSTAPSKVYRVTSKGEAIVIYADPGKELSASTIAVRFGDQMLVGGRMDPKFLICQLPSKANRS